MRRSLCFTGSFLTLTGSSGNHVEFLPPISSLLSAGSMAQSEVCPTFFFSLNRAASSSLSMSFFACSLTGRVKLRKATFVKKLYLFNYFYLLSPDSVGIVEGVGAAHY